MIKKINKQHIDGLNPINGIVAQVLLTRCKKSKQLYGITIEQRNGKEWEMMYSFEIDEKHAKSEGFDKMMINADCYAGNTYRGCLSCGALGYVKCYSCGKLTCYQSEQSVRCAWCNTIMDNIIYEGSMDLSAGID